jgi:pimeloyl-ACP methyl ester carboxylesterase
MIENVKMIVLALAFLMFGGSALAIDESVETVTSRGEVEQRFVLTKPDQSPLASLILLAGGHGGLQVSSYFGSPNFGWGERNFVVRTRKQYARHGLLVATIDAPSDRKKMNAKWRMSKKHAEDVSAVVAYLKRQKDVPVWIVGTSMGTFSAASIAAKLKNKIDGVVLTSSVTRSRPKWNIAGAYPNGIIDINLAKVTAPVFIVSHEDDQCEVTPPGDIQRLAESFSNSEGVEFRLFSGGDEPVSDACEAGSQHGFLGIESQVVDAIVSFIKGH